ncbi:MAG: NAD(P)/FAD-dependent oxidoreductase [Armatimonadota bacterium]
MPEREYHYIIVGGGLTGGSAVEGIRQFDQEGSILLIGKEPFLPYDRPPLTKQLWFEKKKVEDVFVHDSVYYARHQAELMLGVEAVVLDSAEHIITDDAGNRYRYENLLLATGGEPRHLSIPGGNLEGICYYRDLTNYLRICPGALQERSALVVGGGFIGSEIAAALTLNGVRVTMVFPEPYLVSRVFPEYLGQALTSFYRERDIAVFTGDVPAAISRQGELYITETKEGKRISTNILIAGVGINPSTALAEAAGLEIENGIVVNEYLRTSDPAIYAAGDNANFIYEAVGGRRRIEHWDNARSQGYWAGRNMAGAHEPYNYMPYFFSDLFEFGYEAVGDVDSRLETWADWQKANDTGVIYYLRDNIVRGAMMCNIFGKVEKARELIRQGRRVAQPEELRGVIGPAKAA